MTESGETKDDVKIPDDEVGQKINKLFREDEKDTSKENDESRSRTAAKTFSQTLSCLLPWARRPPSTARRPPSLRLTRSTNLPPAE